MLSIKKVFTGTINLDPSYHGWPTCISLNGNELLLVCSGGREQHICPYGRIYLYRSLDGGKSWLGPQKISNGPLDDRDAGLCKTADGTILLNYFTNILAFSHPESMAENWKKTADSITLGTLMKEHNFWMRKSVDNGKSWSPKYSIPLNNPHGPTLLNDGSLFLVGRRRSESIAYLYEGSRLGGDLMAGISRDNGTTWELLGKIPTAPGHLACNCFEPYAIQAADGRIIVHVRDQNLYPLVQIWQCESMDMGKTWSEPKIIGDSYPSHLLKLPDGRLIMSAGHRSEPFGIVIRVSDDCGENWSDELPISTDGLNLDLGYPSSCLRSDGSIFTAWYENIGSTAVLKYCAFNIN